MTRGTLLVSHVVSLLLAERERWGYALPVLIGCGVGLYFRLLFEPPVYAAPVIAACLVGLWAQLPPFSPLRVGVVGLIAVTLGVAAGSVRTAYTLSPVLDSKKGPVVVTGRLVEREARTGGVRLTLDQVGVERLLAADTPQRVRLTLRKVGLADLPPLGARIKVLANLLPPAEPSAPGTYDFRRQAFFEQIGAYGQALRAPEIVPESLPAVASPLSTQRWRERMAERISARIPGAEGAIAVALMTGERGAIDDKTNADMRGAGTAHLLSISGMHISLVGGFVFFLVRAGLALIPWVALRWPIKQMGAVAGLGAVVGYTLLVGAPIPAQRAALMTGLVFLAVLLNRQALTMRTVALAATFLLLLFPESLLNPGFQMSFAAITLLIAAYERLPNPYPEEEDAEPKPRGILRRAGRYVVGIVLTSVIAGLATLPYSAWHFHRLQLLGVLGNLLAVPLTGVIVMPAVVGAYALAPVGLDGWALDLLGWGLTGVVRSAAGVAALPGANLTVPAFPLWLLLLATGGGIWIALWRSPVLRVGGAVVVLLAALLVPFTVRRPLALISPEGIVAVRGVSDGRLYSQRTRTRGLVASSWSLAYNDGQVIEGWKNHSPDALCDALGCVMNGSIALPDRAVALLEDCVKASLLIIPQERVPDGCTRPATRIDRAALRTHGAFAIYPDGEVESTRPHGPTRPWHAGYRQP